MKVKYIIISIMTLMILYYIVFEYPWVKPSINNIVEIWENDRGESIEIGNDGRVNVCVEDPFFFVSDVNDRDFLRKIEGSKYEFDGIWRLVKEEDGTYSLRIRWFAPLGCLYLDVISHGTHMYLRYSVDAMEHDFCKIEK